MEYWSAFFYDAVTILAFCLLILSVVVGYFKFNTLSKVQRIFLYYLSFIFIIEVTTKLLKLYDINNWFVYPFYVSGEFFLLLLMLLAELKIPRKALIVVGLLSLFFFSESFISSKSPQEITSGVGKGVSHLIIICLSGYYLIKSLKVSLSVSRRTFLYIYYGLILYYCVSLIHFLLMSQLTDISLTEAYLIWGTKNVFTATLYGVSVYVFFKLRKQRVS